MGLTDKFPSVPQSITSADVRRDLALDAGEPLSFIQFIKTVKVDYEPETLQVYYIEYLTRWNKKTKNYTQSNKELIVNSYRGFLKDLSLTHASRAEQRYLSQMDFNDPKDLSIAISFFSRKLRGIADYYRRRRRNIKFSVTKNKLLGSSIQLEKLVTEVAINYLEGRDTARIDYNIQNIRDNISVSLTEYFDMYTEYFNVVPEVAETCELDKYGNPARNVYGKNDLGFDDVPADDLFLRTNTDLISSVFLEPGIFTVEEIEDREIDSLLDKKRQFTEKYIGTDFYYISSNSSGDFIYDKLIEADKRSINLLNQDFPTVATTFSGLISTRKSIGYFNNSKLGIAMLNLKRLEFLLDSKYAPDSFYIFPDPALFTNDQDILVFNINKSQITKGITSGIASLQPNTTKEDTSFLGYASESSEAYDLSFVFDKGYIDDLTYDIYGNMFGLLKDDSKYRENISTQQNQEYIKHLVFNGHSFFDNLYGEQFNFDYDIADDVTYTEIIRSGLSAFTNGFLGASDPYNIFFRNFFPYQPIKAPSFESEFLDVLPGVIDADIKDGAFFVGTEGQQLLDPISSDLQSFNTSSLQSYYSELVDCGISFYDGGTVVRALNDLSVPTISADFIYSVRPLPSNNIEIFSNAQFTDTLIFSFNPNQVNYAYVSDVLSETTSIVNTDSGDSTVYNKYIQPGTVYVRDIFNSKTGTLAGILPHTTSYDVSVSSELSGGVKSINLYNNSLFIQTDSYLVIENLNFNGQFRQPVVESHIITFNTSGYDKISTRFVKDESVYYAKMIHIPGSNAKEMLIYPEIYEYNNVTKRNLKIFPTANNSIESLSSNFLISDVSVLYTEIDSPVLTYSTENELFELGFLYKDQNKSPRLRVIQFDYTDTVNFYNFKDYRDSADNFTFIFDDISSLDLFNFELSSSPISVTDDYLIL